MSHSVSYRPIALSAEEVEAIRVIAERQRNIERFLPALTYQAQTRIDLAAASGLISTERHQLLGRQLEAVEDAAAVRAIVQAIPASSAGIPPTSSAPTVAVSAPTNESTRPRPTASNPSRPASHRTTLPSSKRRALSGSRRLPAPSSLPPRQEHLPPTSGGQLPRVEPAHPSPTQASTADARADARWNLIEVRTRLDVLIEEAAALGVDLKAPIAQAERALARAQHYAKAGALGLLQSQLRSASSRTDEVATAIDAALTAAESHRATLERLRSLVRDELGIPVRLVDSSDGLVVEGSAADGRALKLHLEQRDGAEVLVTTVTDLGHALPLDHPHASDLCDPAVATAAQVHQAISAAGGLEAGPVSVTSRPVRGHADARSTTSPSARTSRSAPTPKAKRNP